MAKESTNFTTNYRPSLFIYMDNLFCKHIVGHLKSHYIPTILQHDLRNGYSCERQLITTLPDLMKCRYKNNKVVISILASQMPFTHTRLFYK